MTFNFQSVIEILISLIGGLIGGFISICIHSDSKKMWKNDIFVKIMQEKLFIFHNLLYQNIKNDYDSSILSSLLNNEFDFNSIEFTTFFKEKLDFLQELEEQFIFIQPYLKKCLKINEKKLLELFINLSTSSLIYKYFVSIQEVLSLPIGPCLDDYFNINYNEELHSEEIDNMLSSTQKELQEKFKLHINTANIVLSKENEKSLKALKGDVFYNRIYLAQIRENLFNLKNIISDYMSKEL